MMEPRFVDNYHHPQLAADYIKISLAVSLLRTESSKVTTNTAHWLAPPALFEEWNLASRSNLPGQHPHYVHNRTVHVVSRT